MEVMGIYLIFALGFSKNYGFWESVIWPYFVGERVSDLCFAALAKGEREE